MKKKHLELFTFLLLLLTFCNQTYSQIVNNNSELQTAITNASAGTTIILTNGVWTDINININKTGTITNPVTIKAESSGQVFFEGNCNISLGGSYIVFEGFVFQNASNLISSGGKIEPIIEFRDSSNNECNNCKVSNIKIDSYNGTTAQSTDTFKWILVYGQYNEISNSSFIGKYGVGSIINDNRNDTNPDYTKIHHNYFANRTSVGIVNDLNDQDAIRIGNSSTSLTDSYTEVYDNLFYNWSGEVEIISNKSGKNKYYNNTFKDYQGTLTLRHGNDCEVYNNYFFADNNQFSGGIRVIGEGHKIYNNYIEAVNSEKPTGGTTKTAGAINISNGRPNSALNGYYQVKNVTIVNNTFANCDYGFRVGTNVGSDLTLAPENVTIANNIMVNTSVNGVDELTAPIGTSIYEGNITQNGNWDLTDSINNNQTVASGLLVSGTNFYQLPNGSAAIDSSVGSYSFLTEDILGGTRDSNIDAGAEEFGANGTNLPYTVTDVGVTIGFLSSQTPFLNASTNTISFAVSGGNVDFDVNSNVNWTISGDASWLTLSASNGTNNATLSATATTNNTGTERTATITVSETNGTLSHTITVSQSDGAFDPNDAVSILGLTVTGVGTQNPNIPENTIDNNVTTRWSGNSNYGSAYLTYDLQCSRTITDVNIYFHKGDIRVSSFKIATSTDGNTFTDVTAVLSSSGTTIGFESFPLASNPIARYVRILGYGNSEGSGWNSYEEVEIYGDSNCTPTLFVLPNVFLQGAALNPNVGEDTLMRDDLRVAGLIPTTSPYDSTICNASVFNTTGANAIVDWVQIELRDATTNTTVVATQSALLQRDGDVVSLDGTSALVFNMPSNNYYLVVKHNNHLGIMSASTILLDETIRAVNFADGTTATSGTNAQTSFGMQTGVLAMWAGDTNGDGTVQYSGTTPDSPSILSNVLNDVGNFLNFPTYTVIGYNVHDVNMDGNTQYTGTIPDVPYILQNVLAHPGNFLNFSTYAIDEQLPEN